MINRKPVFLILIGLALPAFATQSGVSFEHKDWEVACDNTLTCRIAGYAAEIDPSGSVLLTRPAGANTIPNGEVTLGNLDEGDNVKSVKKLTLWIDGKPAGDLSASEENWRLSESQTQKLIEAVKGNGKVEFKGGHEPFLLSDDGAYAVMLKADDVQNRIGTPGALTKKGDRPESSVAQAVAKPIIYAAKVGADAPRPLTEKELAVLKARLLATVNHNYDDMCDSLYPAEKEDESLEQPNVTRLDDKHVLLSVICWRAAYNVGVGYWVIDSQLKGKPVLVTVSGTDYDKGKIVLGQKGRGLGDCWVSASWVWDGQSFRNSSEATTGACRYIHAGGTWDLPTLVTEVQPR